MLIVTQSRTSIALPLNTISSARSVEGGWIVTDARGDEHQVDNVSWDLAVEGTPSAMMPALPGTYLVEPGTDEGGNRKVWKTNVLGWMVCADNETRPVVFDHDGLPSLPWQVLHPDGRVERTDGQSWETVMLWIDEVAPIETTAVA